MVDKGFYTITVPCASPTSLLSKLHLSNTPWLFKGLQQSDTLSSLIEDLRSNQILAASDGSFCKDTSVTTAGWVLENATGSQFISGLTTPAFSVQCNGAYRGKLVGLLSIVHMSTYLCLQHNISHTVIHVSCDNIRALKTAFEFDSFKRSPKHKHADILSAISGLLNLGIVSIQSSHVYGHQDSYTPYDQLSRAAQMNVRMDTLAKIANEQVKNGTLQAPISSQHPLGFKSVTIQGRHTHHQLNTVLYSHISEKIMHQWWLSKGRYTLEDIPSIHWQICSDASHSHTQAKKKFRAKWVSGYLGRRRKMRQLNLCAGDSCPFCQEPNETTTHILKCSHQDSISIWNSGMIDLQQKLEKIHTDPELIAALINDL